MKKEGRLSGSGFGVQGSRLARRAARPLIMDESFARIRNAKLEIRNEKWWCGAKMMKRRSILIALRAVVISSVALNLYCRTLIT